MFSPARVNKARSKRQTTAVQSERKYFTTEALFLPASSPYSLQTHFRRMTDGEIRGAARVLCVFARRRRLLTKSKKTRKRNHSSVCTLNRTFRIFFLASCRTKRKNRRLSAYYRRYTVLANRNLTPSPESEPFAAKAEAPTVSRVRRDIFSAVWQQSSCAYTIRARLCMRVWAVWCGPTISTRTSASSLFHQPRTDRFGSDTAFSFRRSWFTPEK